MKRAVVLALALAACSGSPSVDGPERDALEDLGADASPESDLRGVDTLASDVPQTDSDIAPDLTPDVPPGRVACDDDRDCRTSCALGRCTSGLCAFDGPDPLAGGCVIDGLTCLPPGSPDPARATCFFCNPSADVGRLQAEAFAEDFESGVGRLTVAKRTPSPASWTLSTRRSASGARSLYFGDPSALTYDVGERAAARAETPPLVLPPDGVALRLDFQLWADTEETPGFDRLRVLVLAPDDTAREVWTTDAIGGTTRGAFLPIGLELGLVRPGDRVAFEADSIDEVINAYEGFYIDALTLATTCCDDLRACDDGHACTADRCDTAGGQCVFETISGCCLGDLDCDDGDPCTVERCEGDPGRGGRCVAEPIAGCCDVVSDCDDGDPCTEDRCDATEAGGRCGHAPLCCEVATDCDDGDPCTLGTCEARECRYRNACCREDVDCDDGLACTVDSCDAGLCRNDFSYAPGCCIPDVLTERFDAGLPAGWSLSPPTNNVGWRIQPSNQAPSGPSVLYYGHPTLNFYESGGRNTGTATSPAVRLPDGVELTLSASVYLDVETAPQRDLFRIEALVGPSLVFPLVDKAELRRAQWQEVSVDLTALAGQTLSLRFVFDSVDGAQNTTRGVLVDDVRITSSCLPRACVTEAECASRDACIVGTCDEGVCRYAGTCP